MEKVTKEQIEAWKAKYGEVFLLEIEDKKAYLKTPDRKVLSAASTLAQENPLKFNEILLENCWICGDEVIKTNDVLFLSACSKLGNLIETKEASLGKL